ncbi:hypothetical protein C7C46_30155 [Streptomyces tateyamensis]|uniref:PRC-barrel domain-containing protein n=1 Tax=Streptomyces tateyamensis TaxID=565073 RepID=A0A2V4NHV6_9ACTN|nr:PRC-barrel domain-containing protein [Streptomyces tateyamensis]PYC67652.1 hypothetical protein C7C46_30155 [Streptomyces tateyamensis]
MNQPVPYRIGAEVRCADEDCGTLERVVVDPVAHRVTHLVVADRLVPVALVEPPSTAAPDEPEEAVVLRCTRAELDALDSAVETEYLAPESRGAGYASGEALLLPYYGLGAGTAGLTPNLLLPSPDPVLEEHERVPAGEVQIRRGDPVEAEDGSIGKVQGLVVDPADHAVTHVLLQEGHLWGRKTVAIPIRRTYWSSGLVHVRLTKSEVADLPPAELTGS